MAEAEAPPVPNWLRIAYCGRCGTMRDGTHPHIPPLADDGRTPSGWTEGCASAERDRATPGPRPIVPDEHGTLWVADDGLGVAVRPAALRMTKGGFFRNENPATEHSAQPERNKSSATEHSAQPKAASGTATSGEAEHPVAADVSYETFEAEADERRKRIDTLSDIGFYDPD